MHLLKHLSRPGFFWPLLAVILIALLWAVTESKLAVEKLEAKDRAFQHARAVTSSYAEQVSRAFNDIDRTTLLVKHLWRSTRETVRLEDYFRSGVFPDTHFHVSASNTEGDVVTSTLALPQPLNFGTRDWFQSHKANPQVGLLISRPETGSRTGRTILRFSRRLEDASGNFSGAAWVTVEPPYLTTLYAAEALGRDEFISIRLVDGPLLVTKVGGAEGAPRIFYRKDPIFSLPEGIVEEPGEKFTDDASRIVAWKKVRNYPVVALAGLKEEAVYAAYEASAASWRFAAVAGTVLLASLGALGAFYSRRLARRHAESEEIKNTYRLAVDAAQEGFYTLRPIREQGQSHILDFRVEDCNERAAAFVGSTRDKVVGRAFSEVLPREYHGETDRVLRHVMDVGFHEEEFRVPSATHSGPSWVYRRFMKAGNGVAMVVRDISRHKAYEQELAKLANTDTLTALPNRNWLLEFLPEALRRAAESMSKLAVLFVDLDDFKNINDTLGHDAGDELLKSVASRLKAAVRASDHVIRLGGDEFTIVLEHVESTESVTRVAGLVVKALNEPFVLKGLENQRVRASVGISMFPQDGEDGETLLKHADVAMYAAKAAGKGRYHFYQSHLSERLILRLDKEKALRAAIEQEEFVVHYQPRVETTTGRLCSMEALVRWDHPEHGLIFPGEFIQIAEETGLILKLGRIVIKKVCEQLEDWKASGFPLVPVSVNVSAAQFAAGDVGGVLRELTSAHHIAPSLIEIELTESVMLTSGDAVAKDLDELRAMGVKILIDDFGTGYSSLSQLRDLDVDILKIDRAFTNVLCKDHEGEVFFKAIVSLGHALEMSIVAEGVETQEQHRALKELACDSIQGNFVSKPVPAHEMETMMVKSMLIAQDDMRVV